MSKPIRVSLDEYQEHVADNDGICLSCKEWTFGGVEPDASEYLCESCEEKRVMGAEEALMMGELDVV